MKKSVVSTAQSRGKFFACEDVNFVEDQRDSTVLDAITYKVEQ